MIDLSQSGQVDGTDGADSFTTTADLQVIYGYGGNDVFRDTGAANSTLIGGAGDDTYYVTRSLPTYNPDLPQPSAVEIVELEGGGNDTIVTTVNLIATDNVETLRLAPGAVATIGASATGTTLIGNDYGTALQGGVGTDVLIGGLGDDILSGDAEDTAVINSSLAASTLAASLIYYPYAITPSIKYTVTGPDGADAIYGVGHLQFTDGEVETANLYGILNRFPVYAGRQPTTAEVASLSHDLSTPITEPYSTVPGGDAFEQAFSHLPAMQSYPVAHIVAEYLDYGGRQPTGDEINTWKSLLANGATYDSMRTTILDDPLGQTHTAMSVTALYQDYLGRAPDTSEISYWNSQIRSGLDFNGVRAGILNDSSGLAHTDATITALYQEYGGRAPQASELQTWRGLILGGVDFG